jgi:hypothetical protein
MRAVPEQKFMRNRSLESAKYIEIAKSDRKSWLSSTLRETDMRTFSTSVLAGIAEMALLGTAALAAGEAVHQMTVQLPEGGVAQIQYTGDTAPKVTFGRTPTEATWSNPFVNDALFAQMDRIDAQMDRDMDAMFRQARTISFAPIMLAPWPDGVQLNAAALRSLPPGASSFSIVSTSTGNGVCTRMVQVTETQGGKPKVVSQNSGNCGGTSGDAAVQNPTGNSSLTQIKARAPQTAPGRTSL